MKFILQIISVISFILFIGYFVSAMGNPSNGGFSMAIINLVVSFLSFTFWKSIP